jgi:hypothetical protein
MTRHDTQRNKSIRQLRETIEGKNGLAKGYSPKIPYTAFSLSTEVLCNTITVNAPRCYADRRVASIKHH